MTAAPAADVMQSLDSLKVSPVWVDPNHMVESARVLMDGHDLSAICVLDRDGKALGILRRDIAANIPGNARVGEVMEPVLGVLNANESLRQAADVLVQIGRHYAPMFRGDEFCGMVTALDLLDGLRRSWDPMTDLPWSDELRRWGAEKLDDGREIAVIFIDLDRFGTFNKRFGHVVGDRVLNRIASFLREETDPALDVLVRYGGDEFAIGTLRTANEAQELANGLLKTSREAPLTESGEAIAFSVGVYGGQRQRERDDMHVQATLDDLINLASRRCVASKSASTELAQSKMSAVAEPPTVEAPAAEPATPVVIEPVDEAAVPAFMARSPRWPSGAPASRPTPEAAPAEAAIPTEAVPAEPVPAEFVPVETFAVVNVSDEVTAPEEESVTEAAAEVASEPTFAVVAEAISESPSVVEVQIEDDPNSLTHVVLKGGGRVWVGVGLRLGRTLESTVAYATGKALERAYSGRTLRIDSVREVDGRFVIGGTKTENGEERQVSAVAEGNSPEAVADATIAAFLA